MSLNVSSSSSSFSSFVKFFSYFSLLSYISTWNFTKLKMHKLNSCKYINPTGFLFFFFGQLSFSFHISSFVLIFFFSHFNFRINLLRVYADVCDCACECDQSE